MKVPVEKDVAEGLTLVAFALASAGEIEIGASAINPTKKPRRAKRFDVNILPSSLTYIDLLHEISYLLLYQCALSR